MKDHEDGVRFTLRLPADVHAALKRLAEREDRSLHAQVLRIIRNHNDIVEEISRIAGGHNAHR
jgi:hypothetical protein